jgi:N-acetylglucosamine-6-phosphate deacetylase
VIGLEAAVRNLAEYAGCSLDEARLAATTVPAMLLGLDWPIAMFNE